MSTSGEHGPMGSGRGRRRFFVALAGVFGGCVCYGIVGGVAIGLLKVTGNFEDEDAQIPIFPLVPALVVSIGFGVYVSRRARRRLTGRSSSYEGCSG